jgi:hypothetical protein
MATEGGVALAFIGRKFGLIMVGNVARSEEDNGVEVASKRYLHDLNTCTIT